MLSIAPLTRSSIAYLEKEASLDAELLGSDSRGVELPTSAPEHPRLPHLDESDRSQGLEALLDGLAPDGTPLVQHQGRRDGTKRQLGWDLTFNAPKSVSVIWAYAPEALRRNVQYAHDQAVAGAFHFASAHAAIARRGAGGNKVEACGLVAAAFRHGTSRALDPHLHTHLVVPNISFRSDGTSGALAKYGMLGRRRVGFGLNKFFKGDRIAMRFTSRDSGFTKGDLGVIENIRSVRWVGPLDRRMVTIRLDRPSRLGLFGLPYTRIQVDASKLSKTAELAYAWCLPSAHSHGAPHSVFVAGFPDAVRTRTEVLSRACSMGLPPRIYLQERECPTQVLLIAAEHDDLQRARTQSMRQGTPSPQMEMN
tara:strand:+ start:528 stop:1625 length:1098 start_codon:yes stop_codon:yes gene_type:complete